MHSRVLLDFPPPSVFTHHMMYSFSVLSSPVCPNSHLRLKPWVSSPQKKYPSIKSLNRGSELASHRGAQVLSLAEPCFLNSSKFLLSLPEQAVPVLHPRQCLQLPGKLVVQTYSTAGEPVPGYTNRAASLQPPSKCGTSGSKRETVWTSCNTLPLPRAPRSPAGMCLPEVCSGRNSLWLTQLATSFHRCCMAE